MQTEVSISGLWVIMWLFTWGFAKLGILYGLLSIILWPYFLGSALSR